MIPIPTMREIALAALTVFGIGLLCGYALCELGVLR
jgi:hypothetical protein